MVSHRMLHDAVMAQPRVVYIYIYIYATYHIIPYHTISSHIIAYQAMSYDVVNTVKYTLN